MRVTIQRRIWVPLVAVGLVVHGGFLMGANALDTDRALVLLMARRFAEGHFSVYFWAQNYMAALEPALLTPLALLGWATPLAAGMVALGVTAAMAFLSVRLAARLRGEAWVAMLVWAVPPALVVHHHMSLYGARLVASLLVLLAFVRALGAVSRAAWVLVGALLGMAYLGDHLMLPWIAGVAWVAVSRRRLVSVVVGALPLVVFDTVAAMATPAFHLSGPNDPGSWLANVPLLFTVVLPQLFGVLLGRGPGPSFEAPLPVVPHGWAWIGFAAPGLMALAAVVVTLLRQRQAVFGDGDGNDPTAARALVLVLLLHLGLFVFIGGGGERWSVRYLVPLWPALSILSSLAVARWRREMRPLSVLLVLPAVFTLAADHGWPPRGGDGTVAAAEAQEVSSAVREAGVSAVWADYWDAYRLALLVDEPLPWVPLTVIERRPDWLAAARTASPVAYLLRVDDEDMLRGVREGSVSSGRTVFSSRRVGRYHLFVTDGTIPGLVSMHDAPPRGLQMLAALAAGLLFPAAIAAVAALHLLMGRRSRSLLKRAAETRREQP